MKRFYISMTMLVMALVTFAQVTVTINLDMTATDYDEATEDLYYSGDVIVPWGDESGLGWATPGTKPELKFSDNGDGTFTLILDTIKPGYYYMDFYRENEGGEGWGTNGEWSGAPIGIDQLLYVGDEDMTYNSKWGAIYNMTLHVDMNSVDGFDPASDTVYYLDGGYTMLHGTVLADDDVDGIYTMALDSIPQGYRASIFGYGSMSDTVIAEWLDTSVDLLCTRVLLIEDEDIESTFVFGNASGVGITKKEPAQVALFPNPSTGIYNVELDGVYDVMVLDITGKLVHTDVIEYNGMFDLSDHPTGIYIARFTSGHKVATQKILLK
ncbi:MAG: T9SS type A sorting domain-containing protein [Bacteroidota bacterium]